MHILVFNCGSSSLNYKVFITTPENTLDVVCYGKAHRVGTTGSEPSFIEHHHHCTVLKQDVSIQNHREAAWLVLGYLHEQSVNIDIIGHRFVHGGSKFQKSIFLSQQIQPEIEACLPLAPIHNPNSMSVIRECERSLPDVPQYLTFDTAFHASIAQYAYTYALPAIIIQKFGFRKFGFHGLSYQYVSQATANFLKKPLHDLNMIACHLGTGGSSVAAIRGGNSIDTSMGYSPLAGLVMSTRSGDLDPSLPLYLMENEGYTPDMLNDLFNKKSGLLGVSGFSSDIRDLIQAMDERQDKNAALAYDLYTHRLRKYIGAYFVLLGGADVLVFTDDIGVQNSRVRARACQRMQWCGISLDQVANDNAPINKITCINAPESNVTILTIPTDEEIVIGTQGLKLVQEAGYVTL